MNLSLSSLGRAIAIGAVAIGVPALAPQGASAAVECSFDVAAKTVYVFNHDVGDRATIKVNAPAGTLAVGGVLCGAATVYNTDTINVSDHLGRLDRGRARRVASGFRPRSHG